MNQEAILALEDGRCFRGIAVGARGESYGEVVFNTGITGYQEIFTDPSYSGQIVVLTYPQIGNYGANSEDNEAGRPYIEGLVVREFSKIASNWRSREHAADFLSKQNVPIIADIDTRALDMPHGGFSGLVPQRTSDGIARQCLEGRGRNESLGGLGEYHAHLAADIPPAAYDLGRLVGGDAATHAEQEAWRARGGGKGRWGVHG
jgi:hypothetical protein